MSEPPKIDPKELAAAQTLIKQAEEAAAIAFQDRDKLLSFYDARVVFACYSGILSSLGASLRHTGVYTPAVLIDLFTETLKDALLGKSETKLNDLRGQSQGGKQ